MERGREEEKEGGREEGKEGRGVQVNDAMKTHTRLCRSRTRLCRSQNTKISLTTE